MNEINDLTFKLKNRVIDSVLYKDYQESREILQRNQALWQKLLQFKEKNKNYQTLLLSNHKPSFEYEKEVSGIYWELMSVDIINNFLMSEKKLVEMLDSIYNSIIEDLNILTF